MPITLQAPDRQATWKPTWLVEIAGSSKKWAQSNLFQSTMIQLGPAPGVPENFSGLDLVVAGLRYRGLLVEDPVVGHQAVETFFGMAEVSRASFRLANPDNLLDDLYAGDLRGVRVSLKRYDRQSGTTVTELTGKVEDCAQGEGFLEFSVVAPDLSVFAQEVPTGIVDVATFTANAVDVGLTIPVVYGNVEKVRCPYVNDNTASSQYDYLVGRGSLTVSALYRDGPNGTLHTIGASEYTVETTRYSGMTSVRFTIRQVDFSNAFHAIYADVTGLSAERNFARAVKTILSDTTYGLGQSVNAASFTTAETALDTVGSLFCDAALLTPRRAEDVLRELLMVRGMRLGMNSSGEWTITVDTEATTARIALRDGSGVGERNLLSIGPRRRRPVGEAIKSYTLRFRPDPFTGSRLEVSRPVHRGYGSDRVVEHDYIRNTTTADKTVDYWAKREIWGQDRVEVEITQEARQLAVGELVTVTSVPLGYSSETMEVEEIHKGTTSVRALLRGWNSAIYTYAAGTLPTDGASPAPAGPSVQQEAPVYTLAAPTAMTLRQSGAKVVEIDVTVVEPLDWSVIDLFRATTTSTGAASQIERARKKRFHDENIDYATAYTYWASIRNFSCQESALSPGASLTVARIITGDVTNDAITESGSGKNDAGITMATSTSLTELASATISVEANEDVYLFGYAKFEHGQPGNAEIQCYVYRDTTQLLEGRVTANGAVMDNPQTFFTPMDIDSPSTGSHTYSFKAWDTKGTAGLQASFRRMVLLKRKK